MEIPQKIPQKKVKKRTSAKKVVHPTAENREGMVFIPYEVPSSKNSKTTTKSGIPVSSKAVTRYLQLVGVKGYSSRLKSYENYKTANRINYYEKLREDWKALPRVDEGPIFVGVHFVRKGNGRYDFHNMVQLVADLMTAHGWIEDDDVAHTYFVPMAFGEALHTVDNTKFGVYLTVLPYEKVLNGLRYTNK